MEKTKDIGIEKQISTYAIDELKRLVWITDRTLNDVKAISSKKIDVGKEPINKGTLNYEDLNRINNNLKKIDVYLKQSGYFTKIQNTKSNYTMSDIPWLEDINEWRQVIIDTRKMFGLQKYLDEIRLYETLDYIDMNTIEESCKQIGQMILNLQEQQLYCGDVITGGEY